MKLTPRTYYQIGASAGEGTLVNQGNEGIGAGYESDEAELEVLDQSRKIPQDDSDSFYKDEADENPSNHDDSQPVNDDSLERKLSVAPELDSSRNEHGPLTRSVQAYVECLMDLLPSIESMLCHIESFTDSSNFEVSAGAHIYVQQVRDQFPRAENRLIERLGEANWQRYMILHQAAGQASKEEGHFDKSDAGDAPVLKRPSIKSLFAPVSLFCKPHPDNSRRSQSSYADTVASDSPPDVYLDKSEDLDIRVLHLPVEANGGSQFTCHICQHKLLDTKNNMDWM